MPEVSETEQAKFAQRDEEARKKWLLEALSEMLGLSQTGQVGSDEELSRETAMHQGLRMLTQGALVSEVERILKEAGVDPVAANPELHRSYGLAVAGDPQTPQADESSFLGQAQRLGPLGGPGIGMQPAKKAGRIPSNADAILQLARLLRENNRGGI